MSDATGREAQLAAELEALKSQHLGMTNRVRALVENAVDLICELDCEMRYTYVNPYYLESLGWEPDELLGRPATDFVHPEDHGIFERLPDVIEGRGPVVVESRVLRKDGQYIWTEGASHSFQNAEGETRILCIVRDISARKRAMDELSENEERSSKAFQASPYFMLISSLEDGRMLDVNDAFVSATRFSREEVLAMTEEELVLLGRGEQRVQLLERLAEHGGLREEECNLVTRSGETITSLLSAQQIAIAGQKCVIWQAVDMTKRRAAEEALRERERLLNAILAAIKDPPYVLDRRGRTLAVFGGDKALRPYGLRPEDIVGRDGFEFVVPEDLARLRKNLDEVFDTGEPREIEFRTEVLSGFHDLEVCLIPIQEDTGKPKLAIAVAVDVTDKKKAEKERRLLEEKMQQAQKLESLGVLTGGIAHDFNNLLVGVQGNAELALLEVPDDSPLRDRLIDIQDGCQRAAELTQAMLAYAGEAAFSTRRLNLGALLRNMMPLLRGSISRRIVLDVKTDAPEPWIEADPMRIQQVLMNLIINAAEAYEENAGHVVIHTGTMIVNEAYLAECYMDGGQSAGEYGFAEIRDAGCGMDDATLKKIFDPFFTTKFLGRGLGLAATLGIVRSHQGILNVKSSPGRGTTFRVLFRCIDPEPER